MTSILKTDEIQSQNGGAVVKMQTLKHPSASGNNLELGSDGDISVTNNLNVGTIKDATGNTTAMQINSSGHVTRNVIPSFNLGVTNQTITTSDLTTINFSEASYDNQFITGGCSVSSGVVTVPTAGLYYVGANISFESVGQGYVRIFISKNNVVGTGTSAYSLAGDVASNYDMLNGSMIFEITDSNITNNENNFRIVIDTSNDSDYVVSDRSNFFGYLIG